MKYTDDKLKDCPKCHAKFCLPGVRPGPTILLYSAKDYRVVCVSCWFMSQMANSKKKAVEYWNNGITDSSLRKARIKLGLSQSMLSKLSGVTPNQISLYELGKSMPTKKTKSKLERVLGRVW